MHVTLLQQTDSITVNICDDGPGVPDEYLTAIFEPFFRISQARDRNSGGTGLGLAISKHAIEAHQGKITLCNQPNSGLCVTVTLPLEH
jgi:two-component system sensor histidine kinase CpxA